MLAIRRDNPMYAKHKKGKRNKPTEDHHLVSIQLMNLMLSVGKIK